MEQNHLLNAILRQDLVSFIHKVFYTINPGIEYKHNWHIELIADYLEEVRSGAIKRLIVNMPPRALKSVCISVAFPAWILGQDPSKRVIVASYSNVLSVKHSLDSKLVMESEWYKQAFPRTILSKKHNQKSKFLTTENGFRFATSVGGSLTGEGADFLILDDPHNPVQISYPKSRNKVIQWFAQTFLTRLNDKANGRIVVVMQRLHQEDLSNHLLTDNNWRHLKIPIVAQDNITFNANNKHYIFQQGELLNKNLDSHNQLIQLEKEIGVSNYQAQYMQEPLADFDSLLKLDDISFYENHNEGFEYYIQSWDTAIKVTENCDYSVCTCWGILNSKYYLLDVIRSKMTYPELKSSIQKLNTKYLPKFILIEDKASGQSVIQDLRLEGYLNIVAIKPKLDKITRFASCIPIFQAGKILLPKQSNFNSILLNELLSFPNTKHDDIIDSCSQFINFIKSKTKSSEIRIRNL